MLADKINVVSRGDGSGTSGTFIELFDIEQKNAEGKKNTYTNDDCAVGYISLCSMDEIVKAAKNGGSGDVAPALR